jgi:hypothetical protein
MARLLAPSTTELALLAGLDPVTSQPDRIYAVLVWTDLGDRYFHPLAEGLPASLPDDLLEACGRNAAAGRTAIQLRLAFDNGDLEPTSAGRTWRTWSLPSIPAALRHLETPALASALADHLVRGAA